MAEPSMHVTCPRCGQRLPDDLPPASVRRCPACGERIDPQSHREMNTTLWRHERRRSLLLIAVVVFAILAGLFWFLMHPSGASSPARRMKQVVFGRPITEAAEQRTGGNSGAGDSGNAQGQGQAGAEGQGQQAGQSGAQDGAQGAGNAASQGGNAQTGGGGESQGGRGHGQGTPINGPVSGPVNPQVPVNNPPATPAPVARSIGWLDRFFGTQSSDNAPIRAGEGGTGNLPGAGNTNQSTTSTTNVAAEFTESNPPAPAETSLEEPPPSRRSTNRAPAAANTLNDNFEQLLRQHRAGSGDVRISLMWRDKNDLDLHVVEPSGEEIYYGDRASQTGGLLDIDMNAGPPHRVPAVENVFWPERAAPNGTYRVFVNHFRRNDRPNPTPFTVRVLIRGRTTDITNQVGFGEPKKLVYTFTLGEPSP